MTHAELLCLLQAVLAAPGVLSEDEALARAKKACEHAYGPPCEDFSNPAGYKTPMWAPHGCCGGCGWPRIMHSDPWHGKLEWEEMERAGYEVEEAKRDGVIAKIVEAQMRYDVCRKTWYARVCGDRGNVPRALAASKG